MCGKMILLYIKSKCDIFYKIRDGLVGLVSRYQEHCTEIP